jgi:hypothetical protein
LYTLLRNTNLCHVQKALASEYAGQCDLNGESQQQRLDKTYPPTGFQKESSCLRGLAKTAHGHEKLSAPTIASQTIMPRLMTSLHYLGRLYLRNFGKSVQKLIEQNLQKATHTSKTADRSFQI